MLLIVFFFFRLKSKENCYSWCIIVLSTLTSSLNLLNNLETEPFIHFFITIQITLGLFSIMITLIAAWMKKQQYVERINTIDRYVQKISSLIQELDIQLILIPTDRLSYGDFKKKYHPQITEYLSTSPAISPEEWKKTVYTITKYYPELILQDDTELWPWFGYEEDENYEVTRPVTRYGENIMRTYHSITYKGLLYKKCCPCYSKKFKLRYIDNKNQGKYKDKYNDNDKDKDKKKDKDKEKDKDKDKEKLKKKINVTN